MAQRSPCWWFVCVSCWRGLLKRCGVLGGGVFGDGARVRCVPVKLKGRCDAVTSGEHVTELGEGSPRRTTRTITDDRTQCRPNRRSSTSTSTTRSMAASVVSSWAPTWSRSGANVTGGVMRPSWTTGIHVPPDVASLARGPSTTACLWFVCNACGDAGHLRRV